MSRYSPSGRCCGCVIKRWEQYDHSGNPFVVLSGEWGVHSDSSIICTEAGELQLSSGYGVGDRYLAVRVNAELPGQTATLIVADDAHSIALRVTFGEYGVDSAGTVSVKVDDVEEFTTLPQNTGIVNNSGDGYASPSEDVLLQIVWIEGLCRVRAGRGYQPPGSVETKPDEIGTAFSIDWTPKTARLAVEPLTDSRVNLRGVLISKIETPDQNCVSVSSCSGQVAAINPPHIMTLPRPVDSLIGWWTHESWQYDMYASDAATTNFPPGDPGSVSIVRPLGISVTAAVRDRGYVTTILESGGSGTGFPNGTPARKWSLFIDGGAHEMRMNVATIGYLLGPPYSETLELWRGATLLGSYTFEPTYTLRASFYVQLGADRIAAGVTSFDHLIDVATVADYGGAYVEFNSAINPTIGGVVVTPISIKTVECPGP